MGKVEETIRFTVSLPRPLLEELDRRLVARGYASRSELVRDLIRARMVEDAWPEGEEEVAEDPLLEVDAVELLPEVIAASAHFRRGFEENGPNPRLRLMVADARRFVRATQERYDLIVSDNFHPARSGSGSLYTVEHFAAVQNRLTAGGLFCQWLPLHQLDLDTLRSIVRAFITVYSHGWAMLATNSLDTPVLGVVASMSHRRASA